MAEAQQSTRTSFGQTYDTAENSRIDALLNKQSEISKGLENDKSINNQNVLRYSVIIAGAVISLVLFKLFFDKMKK